tara:strand:- start:1078 stop:1230 length:153 start_codon:yes stop_codon:yes gene_type:complete
MIKWALLFFAVWIVIMVVMLTPSSKQYWQNVGPAWEKMLKPPPVDVTPLK